MKNERQKNPALALLDASIEAAREQLSMLREEQRDCGSFDAKLVDKAGALGRAVAALTAEYRKQEKHAQDLVKRMTPKERDQLVWEYISALPPERRQKVREMLDEADAAESAGVL